MHVKQVLREFLWHHFYMFLFTVVSAYFSNIHLYNQTYCTLSYQLLHSSPAVPTNLLKSNTCNYSYLTSNYWFCLPKSLFKLLFQAGLKRKVVFNELVGSQHVGVSSCCLPSFRPAYFNSFLTWPRSPNHIYQGGVKEAWRLETSFFLQSLL